jgi:hypothetical protein
VIHFIQDVYEKFPFKTIITDNGCEFENTALKNWVLEKKINHIYSIPYYHKSNGRVERVNRTIRTALKKSGGTPKAKLNKIIENYNNCYHRALRMSPNDAVQNKNKDEVLKNVPKYKKEFKKQRNKKSFVLNQNVLVKNETKRTKMDEEFNGEGIIIERMSGKTYKVKMKNGNCIVRHVSQLKDFSRGKLDQENKMVDAKQLVTDVKLRSD